MNPGLLPLCPEYAPHLLHCPLTQTHPPIPSWVLPAGGIDVWARAGPAGSSCGLCGIPEVASLAFVALWPLRVVLAILGGRGGSGSGSTEQPSAPTWGHTEPDGLREGGPLRLSGSASRIVLKLVHSFADREAASCILTRNSSPHMAACPIGSKRRLSTDLNLPPSSYLHPLARPAFWSLFLLPLTAFQRLGDNSFPCLSFPFSSASSTIPALSTIPKK